MNQEEEEEKIEMIVIRLFMYMHGAIIYQLEISDGR